MIVEDSGLSPFVFAVDIVRYHDGLRVALFTILPFLLIGQYRGPAIVWPTMSTHRIVGYLEDRAARERLCSLCGQAARLFNLVRQIWRLRVW